MDLLRLLAPAQALPLLLHGGAATGKTRALPSSLSATPPSSTSASSRLRIPDKPSYFVAALHDTLAGLSAQGEVVYLVFDNLEVVRSWDKGAQLLVLLLRLYDLLRLPQAVLVYVSRATPDAYYSMTGSVEPNHIYFPDYTVDEVRDVLMRGHPNPKLYSSFLSVALTPLFRVTRRTDELVTALEPLSWLSRSPATLDAALFDSTGGSSQVSTNMKDTMDEEMLLKGPGTFPLERLLAIFQCITLVSEDNLGDVECPDSMMNESRITGLMSDVLLQLSTLCNSNFLSKSRSCPLEGSARYRCNIDEDLALKASTL
ncbi:Origin of replication complex subunit 1 [Zea mays]|uniref:Origin of replication complex subunit 1 n=1 Tax=Zea mays TaxID=4577 RepID=A0A317YAI4_MAIZE|nr:Origin of replication complex subunit 1 [Zea mays]